MVPVPSLWVPILVAAAIVFVVSSIIHMVIGYHKNDFRPLGREADIQSALRGFNIPPGDYMLPYGGTAEARKTLAERMKTGPVAIMTVIPPGPPSMGTSLALWFVYALVVGVFAAYVSGRALAPGAHYLEVFRFAGTTAFLGYSLALAQNSIWYKRNWGATLRSMFDGLVYGLLTAGTFGWLWPAS